MNLTITIEKLAIETGKLLQDRGLKLATAESCTGGGLSYWLTSVPGSSDWFERGFVTYSNNAKIEVLGVSPETLDQFGAVSEEVANEMADGALNFSQADISIAITGIAGPDGGTTEKPVGTVWLAWSHSMTTLTKDYHFTGDRQSIRQQAMEQALSVLLAIL